MINDGPPYNISMIEEDLKSTWYVIGNNQESFYIDSLTGTIDQDRWEEEEEEGITITFYAQDNAGNIGSTTVDIIKNIVSSPVIYSYDLFILFGLISLMSVILVQRLKRMK